MIRRLGAAIRNAASNDWYVTGLVFAGTFISRLPFRTAMLYAWDSVLYSRAIESFNVKAEQPQPPGHIFYVGLIWLVNHAVGDANAAMVWISIFFASAAAAALFWLGKKMLGPRAGLLAAILLATSTSFWANSEIAYPYTLLAFLSIISAAAMYELWQGNKAWALPAALILGIASGFREDLLLFLLPLLAVGLWRCGRLRTIGAAAVLAAMVAAWYVPAAMLSGGLALYREASSAQTEYLLDYYSVLGLGLKGLKINSLATLRFSLLALSSATPLLILFMSFLISGRFKRIRRDRRLAFLAVWALPSLFFYLFIHIGDYGYALSFLPPALLASAWGLTLLLPAARQGIKASGARIFLLVGFLLVTSNLFLFFLAPTPLSASRIVARDRILNCKIETVRKNFDPAAALIISVYDYQQVLYYLPQFEVWNFDPVVDKHPSLTPSDKIREIIIFDEYLHPYNSDRAKKIDICLDQSLEYLERGQSRKLDVDWKRKKIGLQNT